MNLKLTQFENNTCELTAKLEELQAKESTIAVTNKNNFIEILAQVKYLYGNKKKVSWKTIRIWQATSIELDWLNKQLKEKSSLVLEIKSSYSQKGYDLESKIDDFMAEVL